MSNIKSAVPVKKTVSKRKTGRTAVKASARPKSSSSRSKISGPKSVARSKSVISRKPVKKAGTTELNGSELRKLDSRRRLVAAARKLFSHDGYHDTRTQDIAQEAGVAHGTFYFHFEDKFDCFLAVVNDVSYELSQVMMWELPVNGKPRDVIRVLLRESYGYSRLHPGTLRTVFADISMLGQDRKNRKLPFVGYPIWAGIVDMWKKKRLVSKNFDTKLFSCLVTGAVKQGDAYIARHPRSEKKVLEQMTQFLVGAIGAK